MTDSQNCNWTPQQAEGISGCIINRVVTCETENPGFEAWIASLMKLTDDQERGTRLAHDPGTGNSSREIKPPLKKVAEGPWRSLGGYFDYTDWPDRDRFMELDKAIAATLEINEGMLAPEREPDMRIALGVSSIEL